MRLPEMTHGLRNVAAAVPVLVLLASAVPTPVSAGTTGPDLSLTPVLSGYSRPVFLTHTPAVSHRIFIVEQTGRIKIANYDTSTHQWVKIGTFLDLHKIVDFDDGGRKDVCLRRMPQDVACGGERHSHHDSVRFGASGGGGGEQHGTGAVALHGGPRVREGGGGSYCTRSWAEGARRRALVSRESSSQATSEASSANRLIPTVRIAASGTTARRV